MRALICSPSPMVRLGLRAALTADGVTVVGELTQVADLDGQITVSRRPDVVVLHDPREVRPPVGVPVVMAVQDGEAGGAIYLQALRQGVRCLVSIESDLEAMHRACQLAVERSGYVSPTVVAALVGHLSGANREALERLRITAREAQVLGLLADGASASEIARRLGLSLRTAKYNLSSIYRKLGTTNAVEAVALAYKHGLVA